MQSDRHFPHLADLVKVLVPMNEATKPVQEQGTCDTLTGRYVKTDPFDAATVRLAKDALSVVNMPNDAA